jgi:aspartate carbamoyltransferase catalytic subunit
MLFKNSHLLSVTQLNLENIQTLFSLALQMENFISYRHHKPLLKGAVLANLFFEPSTRTRLSFGSAFNRLGGAVQTLTDAQTSSLSKGESLEDTIRVISGYADVIVIRHPMVGAVAEAAKISRVPVINAGDGAGEHPSQALLDLYTIFKHRQRDLNNINHLKISIIGDLKYSRTAHSLAKLLNLFDKIEFTFVSPEALQFPEEISQTLQKRGHVVRNTTDLAEGMKHCDVLYMARIQEERFPSAIEAAQYKGFYSINRQLFEAHCHPGTIIMHALPRDSREGWQEIHQDLDDLKNLVIFDQTDNGIPVRMALFALILDADLQLLQ